VTDEIRIDSEIALAEFIRDLRKEWHESKYLLVKVRTGRQRTLTQNKALHLFLGMLADELNARNLDMRRVLRHDVEIPWTTDSAKEHLWKPIQEAVIGKESTTEADRIEYTKVYEVLAHHMATKLGVTVPEWPKKKQGEQEAA
jgi:hypothetical protein